jgi:hypothetical protein
MKTFRTMKKDEECGEINQPLTARRLESTASSTNHSGVTTSPWAQVTVIRIEAGSKWIRARYSPNITGTDRRSVRNPDFLRNKTSLTSEVPCFCSNFSTMTSS